MNPMLIEQGRMFLISGLYGFILTGIYDGMSLVRNFFFRKKWITVVSDLLYFLLFAVCIVGMIYTYDNGSIRGYDILGLFLGRLLYGKTVGRLTGGMVRHLWEWKNKRKKLKTMENG